MPKKQEDKSSPLYAPNFTHSIGIQGRIFILMPIVHCFKIIQYAKTIYACHYKHYNWNYLLCRFILHM